MVERAVSAADPAGDAPGVYAVFRQKYAALHDVPVRGQPDVLVLSRGDDRRHERADGEQAHLHEDQRAEVHLPADKERVGGHQLRPDAAGVLPVRGDRRRGVLLEIHHDPLSDPLPDGLQHRRGADSVGAVRVFPGYFVPVRRVYDAADVYVGDLLHGGQLFAGNSAGVFAQPGVLRDQVCAPGGAGWRDPLRAVPFAAGSLCGAGAATWRAGVQEEEP